MKGLGGALSVGKAIGWIGKTTTLHVYHAFLYISLPSLHDHNISPISYLSCGHVILCDFYILLSPTDTAPPNPIR